MCNDHGLLNYAVIKQIIDSQMLEWLEKWPNEMEGMWKEGVVTQYQVSLRDLSGATEEGNKT